MASVHGSRLISPTGQKGACWLVGADRVKSPCRLAARAGTGWQRFLTMLRSANSVSIRSRDTLERDVLGLKPGDNLQQIAD